MTLITTKLQQNYNKIRLKIRLWFDLKFDFDYNKITIKFDLKFDFGSTLVKIKFDFDYNKIRPKIIYRMYY